MRSNHDDGSKVHAVVLTHPHLPPVTLTYTMAGAGAMFADAHAVRQSLPQNTTTQKERNHAILGTCTEDTGRRPGAFELREASAYMCGLRDAGVPVFEMMDAYLKDYMAALKASPVVNQN